MTVHAPTDDLARHLAIILAGVAPGCSVLPLPEGSASVRATCAAMDALGADIRHTETGVVITGTGNGYLLEAARPLDFGGNTQAALLIAGLVSTYAMPSRIIVASGETEQLATLTEALGTMGVQAGLSSGAPVTLDLQAPPAANPADHDATDWSADIAAAVMLAALNAPGRTAIGSFTGNAGALAGPFLAAGAEVTIEQLGSERCTLAITGQPLLKPFGEEAAT